MGSEEQKLILTVITYGPDQRRAEIELRPTIPEAIVGYPRMIHEWVQMLSLNLGPDVKFTNEWGCEICGKPARESKYFVATQAHLAEPKVVFYVHNLCKTGNSRCHAVIKEQEVMMAKASGLPPPPDKSADLYDPAREFPLASSCAKCNDEKTARKDFKMSRCGGCKLTRYCSPGCQKADWPRHKRTCKIVESVKWIAWP